MKKRRSSRRPHLRTSIIALILVVLATIGYLTYRYFFVPQPVTIAKLIEDVDGDITFTQTAQQESTGVGGTLHNKKTGKTIKVDTAQDLTKALEIVKSKNITTAQCQSLGKILINGSCITPATTPVKVTTPGAPLDPNVITAEAQLCPVGNTTAPVGSWVATGEGLDENGNVCKSSGCPFRACVKVEAGCKINYAKKAKCGDIFVNDPTKLVASNAMGCQYFNTETGQSNTDCTKPLATCYSGGTAYPSGSTKDGKVCNDGDWVEKYNQALCDFIHGDGKTTLDSNGKCISKPVVATTTKDVCDGKICSDGKICHTLPNGWECIPDPAKLKPAGATVSSASECASHIKTPDGWQYVCKKCTEGINPQDSNSYYTCDANGKAVYHNCSPKIPKKTATGWVCYDDSLKPVTPTTFNEDSTGINSDYSYEGDGNTPPAPAQPGTAPPSEFKEATNTLAATGMASLGACAISVLFPPAIPFVCGAGAVATTYTWIQAFSIRNK
ncbi:MAG: hypothetical protein UX37_C0006G0023 [Microgenomates group bacterium GW2011_GWA2_46_16]|nr:MAG: hypothetical protein UX37_C0006G0023 [Microgenomates group bacterium GW2011_GWA2_46_16]